MALGLGLGNLGLEKLADSEDGSGPDADWLMLELETPSYILLETGDKIVLE